MQCPRCRRESDRTARFCMHCGAQLPSVCLRCQTENPPDSQSCSGCGAPLSDQREEFGGRSEHPGDRRQVTILFCDLVDSTGMTEQLDPEVMRDILRAYREACAVAVERYGGRIARYIGDGILVYFGYPQAHEDAPRRAVHAGLEILSNIERLRERLQRDIGVPVAARLGIHTGLVVAGDFGSGATREDMAIVGPATNIAARLQAIAGPGKLVISDETRRLVDGLFSVRLMGAHDLKGITHQIFAYEVLGPTEAASAFEAKARLGLFPFVGRDLEHSLLLQRWERALHSERQVVLLSGEAGIGKSRLIRGFRDGISHQALIAILVNCSPYHSNSAFYPFIEQFERALQLRPNDSTDDKLDKLDSFLGQYGLHGGMERAALASFLSLDGSGRYRADELTPRQAKARAVEAIASIAASMAARQPVLVAVEDAHWIDPSSWELLELLIERLETKPVLFLLSHRPEFQVAWLDRAFVTSVTLERLPVSNCQRMIASIAGENAIPARVQDEIVAKSDGIPLFVEELTKAVLESELLSDSRRDSPPGSAPLTIPNSLKDSLMARLDRLGSAKEVAQLAAVIGRRFSLALLMAASPLAADTLSSMLSALSAAQLIYRTGSPSQELFEFKHALVQDAAYESLLKATRVHLHAHIAGVLEEKFSDTAANEPELLAHHYTQAERIEQAVAYWQRAGQRALERAANVEAMAYLNKALELLARLPETTGRNQLELALLVSRGVALTATRSYASAAVGENYARAHELCRKLGSAPQVFPVLHGLYRFYLVRADLGLALETTRHLLTIAAAAQNPTLLMQAHQAHSFSLGFKGRLDEAQRHCEECVALFAPDRLQGRMHVYATDTAASVLCMVALLAWLRGYPDRAAEVMDQALTRAREVNHPYTLAWTLNFAAVIHQIRGEVDATLEMAEQCIRHSTQHEFPFWLAGGRVMAGWARVAAADNADAALAETRDGLASWRATGAVVFSPYYLSCVTDGYRSLGRSAEGFDALSDMIAAVQETGERWWEPELHRLKGELLLDRTSVAEEATAEQCFRHALDLARSQDSRSLELRAAMSLAKLYERRGQRTDADGLMTEVYGRFDQGFDTADLRAARALTAALR